MELRHIRYFATLADTLNFTRAAEKCHITQSTLSHQIKQLEEELGISLFDRIGKRVVITEAGDALLERLRPALEQIDQALKVLRDNPDNLSGHVRIGATHSFNTNLVPQCIARFLDLHPSLKVTAEELSQSCIVERLQSGDLDLGIAYRPLQTHTLWFEPLYNEEMVLVVADWHPFASRKRVRMMELHNLRMTLLSNVFSTRKLLDEHFYAVGAMPQVVVEMNSIAPMIELIRKTELAGIIGATAVIDTQGIAVVPLENPTPVRTPGLLWLRGETRASLGMEFAKAIRQVLNRDDIDPDD